MDRIAAGRWGASGRRGSKPVRFDTCFGARRSQGYEMSLNSEASVLLASPICLGQ